MSVTGKCRKSELPQCRSLWRICFAAFLSGAALAMSGCGDEGSKGRLPAAAPIRPTKPAAAAVREEAIETPEKFRLIKSFASQAPGLKAIAVGPEDHVYAGSETGVTVLDGDGRVLRSLPTESPVNCLAAARTGELYVGHEAEVAVFDKSGKKVRGWGRKGKGRGEFMVVTAIDVSGPNVFVADAGNRRVHRFDLTGDFIDDYGVRDREAGYPGLVCPSAFLDCRVAAGNVLHIVNPGMLRIEKRSLNGELLGFWGTPGVKPENFIGCCNPINIALTSDGRIVTAEKGVPRVKVYDNEGKLLAFLGEQYFSKDVLGLDLAVDSTDRVFVADPGDGRIHVFAQLQARAQ